MALSGMSRVAFAMASQVLEITTPELRTEGVAENTIGRLLAEEFQMTWAVAAA